MQLHEFTTTEQIEILRAARMLRLDPAFLAEIGEFLTEDGRRLTAEALVESYRDAHNA